MKVNLVALLSRIAAGWRHSLTRLVLQQRRLWLCGLAGYSLMFCLNLLLGLLLGQPAELLAEPALAAQMQQTDASLSEISQAIDKLAERKALYER